LPFWGAGWGEARSLGRSGGSGTASAAAGGEDDNSGGRSGGSGAALSPEGGAAEAACAPASAVASEKKMKTRLERSMGMASQRRAHAKVRAKAVDQLGSAAKAVTVGVPKALTPV
jgi:hypothetical protein